MIPKIIHYCWLSGETMPEEIKACVSSWQRVMPDWEFRLWDMRAIEGIDSIWLRETIQTRMWAFACDFIRLYAVYNYGGIYLDTDVYVFESFLPLLNNNCFIGRETSMHIINNRHVQVYLGSHCFGSVKGNLFIKKCLDYYDHRRFILSRKIDLPKSLRYDMTILPEIQTKIACEYGYDARYRSNYLQNLDTLTVYPSTCFDSIKKTPDRYCAHLALGSWRDSRLAPPNYNLKYKITWRIEYIIGKILKLFNYTLIKLQ